MIARNRLEDHAGLFGQEYEGRKVEMPRKSLRRPVKSRLRWRDVLCGVALGCLLGWLISK